MTDLRQAAQAVIHRWDSPLWKNGSTADAIADLRTALEQQQAEPVEGNTLLKAFLASAKEAGVTHLQQAEPVAWMTHSHDLLPLFHRTERAALVWGAEPTPLYTASPQRKPLTDEQVHAIWDHKYRGWFSRSQIEDITRAIEVAHGIKEGT